MSIAGAFIIGLAAGLIGYAWISAPERRRQQLRSSQAITAARKARDERDEALGNVDYWRSQYHGGVDAIIDRLRVAVDESPVEDTPLFDRACLAWLDKSTEWDDAS